MQTPRKVPYIGPRCRRLDEVSGRVLAVAIFWDGLEVCS